jgi:hypothetical protein
MSKTVDLWNEWSEHQARKLKTEPTANAAQVEAHNPAVPDNDAAWEAWAREACVGLMAEDADG